MQKNTPFLIFLLFVFSITLWYGAKSIFSLKNYYDYSNQVPAKIVSAQIREIKKDRFGFFAFFAYEVKEKSYLGKSLLTIYPNNLAAERRMNMLNKDEKILIWYQPSSPEHSIIEKSFPYKSVITAVLLVGLCVYLLILGYLTGLLKQKS